MKKMFVMKLKLMCSGTRTNRGCKGLQRSGDVDPDHADRSLDAWNRKLKTGGPELLEKQILEVPEVLEIELVIVSVNVLDVRHGKQDSERSFI